MEITAYAVAIWITAIVIVSLDVVMLIGSKNLSSRMFVLLTFITALWVASQGFLVSTSSYALADWLIRFQYIFGMTIAVGFYLFSTVYPHDKRTSKLSLAALSFLILVFAYLSLFTVYINAGVIEIGGNGHWAWSFGPWHLLFDFTFYILWILALSKLYRTYRSSEGNLRTNLGNMLWALLLGIMPPTMVNIVLPSLGYYSLNWIGPISSAIWIFIIAYSIIRYRQMNVRAVVTEVLAIGMAAIFFINIFIDTPFGITGRLGTFIIFLVLAYFLIRGVLLEVEQRDELHDLNTNLSAKVAEQTVEIRRAYEAEKHARLELEKLNDAKDQFIMITQHHLRTPVSGIQWQLEDMSNEAAVHADSGLRGKIASMRSAADRLMTIVNDFLNITAIKVGTNILDITACSLKPAIEDILAELRSEIERLHVSVNYPRDDGRWPVLKIDCGKIREILFIVMENAVRYNHDGGSITITPQTSGGMFELVIENTGIGITKEEAGKIGSSLFYRGQEARQSHPIGMGIGLSVVKAVVKAHHGTFSIESRGKGEGAKVTVKLPI